MKCLSSNPPDGSDRFRAPGAGALLMARLLLATSLCAFGYSLGYQRGQAAPAVPEDGAVARAADPYSAALFASVASGSHEAARAPAGGR